MGLENYPSYRKGGRLENYQEPIELSINAFDGLKTLVRKISETILNFDTKLGEIITSEDQINRIKSICEVDMVTMASKNGLHELIKCYKSKQKVEVMFKESL